MMADGAGTVSVAREQEGSHVRIVVRGELDIATVPQLEQHVASDGSADAVTLDLSGVTFIDSTGLRLLLEAHRSIGDRLRIRASPACERLFEITGVRSRLPVLDG